MRLSPLPLIGLPPLASLALSLVLCIGWVPSAGATESAAATAAIARLLSLPVAGSENAAASADAGKRAVVLSLRGENLDRVVRRAWPKQPFKDEVVRKAFVQINADTLGKNPSRVLPPGTPLAIPTEQDLLALLGEHYPAVGLGANAAQHESPAGAALATKRRWVHYP